MPAFAPTGGAGRRWRVGALLSIAAALAVLAALAPPLAQPQDYHWFADARSVAGVRNTADTLSNLALLWVGAAGLVFLRREHASPRSARFDSPLEIYPYAVFFLAAALAAAGSAFYHLDPRDATLVWDRIPIAAALAALVAALVGERIDARAGARLLAPLVLLGLASVAAWRAGALLGAEDLRPYAAVQFGSIAIILATAMLFASPYSRGGDIYVAVAVYAAAKLFELYDWEIYALGGWASGHTLKHLAAALAAYLVLRSLERRVRRPNESAIRSAGSAG